MRANSVAPEIFLLLACVLSHRDVTKLMHIFTDLGASLYNEHCNDENVLVVLYIFKMSLTFFNIEKKTM